MPIIVDDKNIKVINGEQWIETTLADSEIIGEPAIVVCRLALEAGATGPQKTHHGADQLLYVIRGSGTAFVNDESLPLDEESVLWLEPGEQYHFMAGEDGLEILQGYNEVNGK